MNSLLAKAVRGLVRSRRACCCRSQVGWTRPVIELTVLSAGAGHHRSYVRRIGTSSRSFPDFSVGAAETLPRNNLPEFKTINRQKYLLVPSENYPQIVEVIVNVLALAFQICISGEHNMYRLLRPIQTPHPHSAKSMRRYSSKIISFSSACESIALKSITTRN